jgi:hypothetical protein
MKMATNTMKLWLQEPEGVVPSEPQHRLYFSPLPQGQGSFRLTFIESLPYQNMWGRRSIVKGLTVDLEFEIFKLSIYVLVRVSKETFQGVPRAGAFG